jgi:hypothetical protein
MPKTTASPCRAAPAASRTARPSASPWSTPAAPSSTAAAPRSATAPGASPASTCRPCPTAPATPSPPASRTLPATPATPATRPVSTLDTTAPTISIAVVAGDDVIDDAEDNSVTLSGSTSGVENGQTVSVTLVNAGGAVVYSGSATVSNNAWSIPGVDLSALPDGASYTVTASVSDAAGNAATPATRPVSTIDTIAPTISIAVVAGDDVIDDAEDNSVTLSGSTSGVENGQTVSVTLRRQPAAPSSTAAAPWSATTPGASRA